MNFETQIYKDLRAVTTIVVIKFCEQTIVELYGKSRIILIHAPE